MTTEKTVTGERTVARESWSQIRCEELAQWYDHACAQREEIKAQRDELLAAAKQILEGIETEPLQDEAIADLLRPAIARVEGGK